MAGLQLVFSHAGKVRRLEAQAASVTVGRSPGCTFVLPFEWLAQRHLIVQIDPPFARTKLLDAAAAGHCPQGQLAADRWTRLAPGDVVSIPSSGGGSLEIGVEPLAANPAHAAGLSQMPAAAVSTPSAQDDGFGVLYATDSALDGRSGGWFDAPETPSFSNGPLPPVAAGAPTTRRRPGRTIGLVSGVVAVLIVAAASFAFIRGQYRQEAIRQDLDVIRQGIDHSNELVTKKEYVAAKMELDRARSIADGRGWADKLQQIDQLLARPAIRFGAAGQVLMEGRWLPPQIAAAWKSARERDDPKLEQLESQADAAMKAKRWEQARGACEQALALMDSEPVKDHPHRGNVQEMLTRIRIESVREEMEARGLVLHQDQWVTPQRKFELQQIERGMVQYQGKWLSKADAFAAAQREKGLVEFNGRWMTVDEMKVAQGFVQFEGAWVTPKQRDAIVAQHAAEARRTQELAVAEARRRERQREDEARAAQKAEELKETAYQMSQEFVKDRLKSPTTAQFQPYNNYRVSVTYSDGWYVVSAVVDAQNSFGATIRSRYLCKLRPKNGTLWEAEHTLLLGE